MAATEVKMKLMVDSNSNRVLFADVGKECVDFLFNLLSLPIGTVIRLLNKKDMVGSIANLYVSIENLNQTYLQPNQTKDMLLQRKLPVSPASIPLLTLPEYVPITGKTFYSCSSYCYEPNYVSECPDALCPECKNIMATPVQYVYSPEQITQKTFYSCNEYCYEPNYVSECPDALCPRCNKRMATPVQYVDSPAIKNSRPGEGGGIVKGEVTYMVLDNLEVKPMSTISSITLLNRFNVKDVCALQEKIVTLTMDKALKLLKLSFKSTTVLTDVFLP